MSTRNAPGDLTGLVVVGARTVEMEGRRRPGGLRSAFGVASEPPPTVEIEVLADKRNFARVVAYRYPDGTLEYVQESDSRDEHVPLGVVRKRDPARQSDKPTTVVEASFTMTKAEHRRIAQGASAW